MYDNQIGGVFADDLSIDEFGDAGDIAQVVAINDTMYFFGMSDERLAISGADKLYEYPSNVPSKAQVTTDGSQMIALSTDSLYSWTLRATTATVQPWYSATFSSLAHVSRRSDEGYILTYTASVVSGDQLSVFRNGPPRSMAGSFVITSPTLEKAYQPRTLKLGEAKVTDHVISSPASSNSSNHTFRIAGLSSALPYGLAVTSGAPNSLGNYLLLAAGETYTSQFDRSFSVDFADTVLQIALVPLHADYWPLANADSALVVLTSRADPSSVTNVPLTGVRVYPNPTAQGVYVTSSTIDLADFNWSLLDVGGRVITAAQISVMPEGVHINVDGLPMATYQIIGTDGERLIRALVLVAD